MPAGLIQRSLSAYREYHVPQVTFASHPQWFEKMRAVPVRPVARFAFGARFTARRLARHLAGRAERLAEAA